MCHILLHSPTHESASRRVKMTTPNNHPTDQKETKDSSDVATNVGYVGSSLYVIPKRASQELEGLQRLLPPLESEHIEWVQTSQLAPISPRASP
jgi:hypothetical protein